MAKMAGRCRGKGIGPRIGSSVGRTSAVAARTGGTLAEGGGSRCAPNSGGFVAFGFGHAIPRSEELTAPVEAGLSVDRGRGLAVSGMAAAPALPVDVSP